MLQPLFALICALFVFAVPAAALAQTAAYNISGNFAAPATGSFAGTYVVNAGTNTIVSVNIHVTAGKARDGVTNVPANTYVYAGLEAANLFTYATAVPASGLRGGFVRFAPTKVAPTAITQLIDGVCVPADCSSVDNGTTVGRLGSGTVVLATVAPVPTLSEWAMIMFGLVLSGGAAVYIQRRQLAV